jgi:antirestriction protein ArdC
MFPGNCAFRGTPPQWPRPLKDSSPIVGKSYSLILILLRSTSVIRDEVTARIIEALQADLLPWRRPWRAPGGSQPGRHSNVASRKPYQGINPLLLELHAMRLGLTSRWWGTFPMWKSLGCIIRKRPQDVEPGNWGCRVVFWKPIAKPVIDYQTGEEEEDEKYFILKTFTIFCADQVEGAEAFRVQADDGQSDAQPDFAPAEELIAATQADIRFGGDRAYYRRPTPEGSFPNHHDGDFIVLPPRTTFDPPAAFYETASHELVHWTESRVGFHGTYAMGELVAEIASCFVSAELGIPQGEGLCAFSHAPPPIMQAPRHPFSRVRGV